MPVDDDDEALDDVDDVEDLLYVAFEPTSLLSDVRALCAVVMSPDWIAARRLPKSEWKESFVLLLPLHDSPVLSVDADTVARLTDATLTFELEVILEMLTLTPWKSV
ncbi:MAG TPA: hypothetical protein VGM82_10545 [Gemmatimonadaceae bacterium]|jgi:hypothetical protein